MNYQELKARTKQFKEELKEAKKVGDIWEVSRLEREIINNKERERSAKLLEETLTPEELEELDNYVEGINTLITELVRGN